jgi:ATP-dependent DNA ligase
MMTMVSARHGSVRARSLCPYAFDLIELNGDDLRRDPLEVRKATLASIVTKASPGIRFNEHIEGGPLSIPAMLRPAVESTQFLPSRQC